LFRNLDTLAEIAHNGSIDAVRDLEKFDESVQEFGTVGRLPQDEDEVECHLTLTQMAVKTAVGRHAGKIEVIITRDGDYLVQRGKDLTNVKLVIGAGGPIAFSKNPQRVLQGALFQKEVPTLLKPKQPKFMLDARYILFAIGLLAQSEPIKAFNIY